MAAAAVSTATPPSAHFWSCGQCTCNNELDVSECVACSSPRPGTGSAAPPKPASSQSDDAGGWQCVECTTINYSGSECEACMAPRPGGGGGSDSTPLAQASSVADAKSAQPNQKFGGGGGGSGASAAAASSRVPTAPVAPTPSDWVVSAVLLDASAAEYEAKHANSTKTGSASNAGSAAAAAPKAGSASDAKNSKSSKQ